MLCSFLRLALVQNQMTSVLDGFSWRHFEVHQLCTASTHFYIVGMAAPKSDAKDDRWVGIKIQVHIAFFNHWWKIHGVCNKLQWFEDGTLRHTAADGKGILLICSDLKISVRSARYKVYYSQPYLVFVKVVPGYRADVCDPPYRTLHLNLIR